MNDLRQNELLSAYLDGELSAAEQAQVERLLADSPEARRLVEELRALSATLQSLPQEKPGFDFGPRVLRAAERRMLIGEESEARPTPLVRSVFRRLFNRRGLAWAGLAVAIGALIAVYPWQQGAAPIGEVAREVALAPRLVANNRIATTSEEPATIRAAFQRDDRSQNEMESLAAESPEGGMTATLPSIEESSSFDKTAAKLPDTSPAAPQPERRLSAAPQPSPTPMFSTLAEEEGKKKEITGQLEEKDALAGSGGGAAESKKSDAEKQDVLVVRCDISPEAAEQNSLEKLLEANGISWRERASRIAVLDKAKQDQDIVEDAKPTSSAERLAGSASTDALSLVWAEATAAQLKATLAGLAAQPDVFLTFSVQPAQERLSRDVVERYFADGKAHGPQAPGGDLFQFEQAPKVAGGAMGRGVVGQLDIEVRQKKELSTTASDKPLDAAQPQEGQPTTNAFGYIPQRRNAPAQRRPVLFVLRVVDQQDKPAAAAAETSIEPKPSEPAKPPVE